MKKNIKKLILLMAVVMAFMFFVGSVEAIIDEDYSSVFLENEERNESNEHLFHIDDDLNKFCDVCNTYTSEIKEEGKCGDDVYYKLFVDGTVIISGNGYMWDYINGRTSPFNVYIYGHRVGSVIIENGVESIGFGTFAGNSSLKNIVLGKDIKEINEHAFSGCGFNVVNYAGTFEEWNEIKIENRNNDTLINSVIQCGYCFFTRSLLHDYISRDIIKSTCSNNGVEAYVCLCGDNYYEITDALGHDEINHEAKGPTCTEIGWNAYVTCSRCDYTTYEEIAATGHKEETLKAVSPTCTKTGLTEGKKCSVCSTITVAQKTVAKNAHTYKSANCTAPKTCKVCKATTGKALGHKYSNSCDTKCNVCSAKRSITHSYKTVTTTKATLTKNGKQVTKCTVCGNVKSTKTIYYPKTIKLSATSYTYNGKVKTPSVTVKDSKGKTLKKNTDYTVKYSSGRKSTGKYAVTITFKGKYSGTKKLTFTIVPKAVSLSKVTAGSKQATVAWNTTTGASGYQVMYSTSSKFKSSKTATVKKGSSKKTTIKKLTKGKKYYFKVRAYKTVGSTKVYGAWSSVKSVKVK